MLLGELELSPLQQALEDLGVGVLRSALRRLPDHQGVVVSRMKFNSSFLSQISLIGNLVEFPAFTSADDQCDVFAFRPHRLIIQSYTGKHVQWISENAAIESEVLFNSPTWFRVLDVEHQPNGHIWFWLEEVTP